MALAFNIAKKTVIATLRFTAGDVRWAAEHLGVSRTTLYNYLKKFGIDQNQFRRPRRKGAA